MSLMTSLHSPATRLVDALRSIEDRWFDATRNVDTSADPGLHPATDIIGPRRDGHPYLAARPRSIRHMLGSLPIRDTRGYTFIDLGSGKGRVVFLAAELPFRKVVGVEYSIALHTAAVENLRKLRAPVERGERIELLHADAASYALPPGNLVVHLFNPFGPAIMADVMRNLVSAMENEPRHVVVVLLWPTLSELVAAVPAMRLSHREHRFDIFEAGAPA